jgi:hypothetical protein
MTGPEMSPISRLHSTEAISPAASTGGTFATVPDTIGTATSPADLTANAKAITQTPNAPTVLSKTATSLTEANEKHVLLQANDQLTSIAFRQGPLAMICAGIGEFLGAVSCFLMGCAVLTSALVETGMYLGVLPGIGLAASTGVLYALASLCTYVGGALVSFASEGQKTLKLNPFEVMKESILNIKENLGLKTSSGAKSAQVETSQTSGTTLSKEDQEREKVESFLKSNPGEHEFTEVRKQTKLGFFSSFNGIIKDLHDNGKISSSVRDGKVFIQWNQKEQP